MSYRRLKPRGERRESLGNGKFIPRVRFAHPWAWGENRIPRTFVIICFLLFTTAIPAQDAKKESPRFTSIDYPVGNFSLDGLDGEIVTARDLRGSIWIVQTFVPGCNECSKSIPTMKRLQEIVRGNKNVKLVSIALAFNDADTLQKFARDQNADPEQWLFLTDRNEKRLHETVTHAFLSSTARNPQPTPGNEIVHSTRILIIDPQGIIVGSVAGAEPDSADFLKQEIERIRMRQPIPVIASHLPRFNAVLNGSAGMLLLLGWLAIRLRQETLHKILMLLAFAVSMAFLASYLFYHFAVLGGEPMRFRGEGAIRAVYFAILLTHTVLAVAVAPLAIFITVQGLRGELASHRRVAKWTLPIWLYVSITGVMVYWMLYEMTW